MEYTTIISRVCLEPKDLDSKIMSHLFEKVKSQMNNVCSKQYGYILEVVKILEIVDNRISAANSDIVFTVKYQAKTLKPEKGKVFKGEVCIVFNKGIFVNIENKIKILVTTECLVDYKHDEVKNMYVSTVKKEESIKKGDTMDVEVTGVMYAKQKYSCFGKNV